VIFIYFIDLHQQLTADVEKQTAALYSEVDFDKILPWFIA